jgi:hypothetical protein
VTRYTGIGEAEFGEKVFCEIELIGETGISAKRKSAIRLWAKR